MSNNDLELTLDGVPIEYPALVKEAVLNLRRAESTSNCASLNEKYCWFLSKSHMFIWDRLKSNAHRTSIPTQLPLPPSGLVQSTKCIVVYDGVHRNATTRAFSPGVLVVSPEGVLRHWTSIQFQNYAELVLDLNNEVVLRVELVDPPADEKCGSFILTTTSGTIYFLRGELDSAKNGFLQVHRITGRESHGIRKRLSSIMFGGLSRDSTSLVSNSFQFWKKNNELLIVCVSPDMLSVYDVGNKCELWSLKAKGFFHEIASNFIESDLKSPPNDVKTVLVDAAPFRDGLMVLVSSSHDDSPLVSLNLVYLSKNWQNEIPLDSTWSSRVPLPESKSLFLKNNPLNHMDLTLCISKRSADTNTSERTDGIIIVHPHFVQAMYVPDDLENTSTWDLPLCKSVTLPTNDQLIGIAINKQYCYIMMLASGVSTIRLLPKGFSDGAASIYSSEAPATTSTANEDWGMLSDLLSEMVASGLPKSLPPQIESLYRAFECFGEKDMVRASNELKNLAELSNSEIALIVEQFMYAILNYTDPVNRTDTELNAKMVLTSRMLLFLKHMGLYDKIAKAKLPYNRSTTNEYRNGLAMLAEMNERVSAALAIFKWRSLNENNNILFDSIADKAIRTVPEVLDLGLSDKDTLFGRIGLLHCIPTVTFAQILQAIGKSQSQKYELFHTFSELLITIKDFIGSWRRNKSSVPKGKQWWTVDTIAIVYRQMCLKIIEELKDGVCSESERSRLLSYVLSLYDFYLGEIDIQPDGDQVLFDTIYLGRVADSLALAEKHKDFGVLVKIHLNSDKVTRQKTLNRLKKMFEKDDFEMYLCQYLKNHGFNEVLLEQRGERVDAYLDNFKELRFSREISNKQYAKAAYTLMSLANNETKSFSRFADFLSRAYFCAKAANETDDGVEEVLDFYRRRLPELTHRRLMPPEIVRAGYGDDLDVMMSVEEMLEWNMALQPNDDATVEGYVRSFHLLSDLLKVAQSDELNKLKEKSWKTLIDLDEWSRVRNRTDIEKKTIFGKLCDYLVSAFPNQKGGGFPIWCAADRLNILPTDYDRILESCQLDETSKEAQWIKAHFKWVTEKLKNISRLPKTAFYRPDTRTVASTTMAVLSQFQPILKRREEKLLGALSEKDLNI